MVAQTDQWSHVPGDGRRLKPRVDLSTCLGRQKSGGDLYKNLRHRGKKYNKRSGSYGGRGRIPGRVDIDERPEIVEKKQRLGDWELDTIIGAKHQGAVVSAVDRSSKYCVPSKIPDKSAIHVTNALSKRLGDNKIAVLIMTADNGKEFAGHEAIAIALGANFYFAKPYHSWQRGRGEHTNGLVRQYLPKSSNLKNLCERKLDRIENLLNNRSRKVLNYKTPKEVFFNPQLIPT